MLKRHLATAFAACVIVPTVLAAQSDRFSENYTLPVTQIDATSFEVVEADGAGNSQLWCAAGLYARNGLGLTEANLTITTPRGPSQFVPGRKGVVFTTAPVRGAFTSVWPGVGKVGRSYRVAHAYALCSDLDFIAVRTGPNTLIRR